MDPIFIDKWETVGRAVVLAVLAYFGMLVILRASGERTLAKMNAFDFVVVVALGEILAHTVLSKEVTLVEGLAAVATLVLLQVVLAWLTVRSKSVESAINGKPALLFHKGRFLHDSMRAQRITEEEIRSAIREHEIAALETVHAVILETDGTLSVVWRHPETPSAVTDVPGYSA
jgi:uncharacterized membrane protein YcaP (DUF421 family)